MSASETKKLAREALQGKWGKVALQSLVFALLTGLISSILGLIPGIGSLISAIIEVPLAFGFIATLIKIKRGEDTTYTEFLSNGFSNFASSWLVTLWTLLKMIIPIILVIVSIVLIFAGYIPQNGTLNPELIGKIPMQNPALVGIGLALFMVSSVWLSLKQYFYKPVLFILFDNPTMSAKEIVEESERLMTGNRWKFFCLELSFIGWIILVGFTFGIGMLWLTPYMLVAEVVFYEALAGKTSTKNEDTNQISE